MEAGMKQTSTDTFEYREGYLQFSEKPVRIEIMPDQIYQGTFGIRALKDYPVSGQIFCNDVRMRCSSERFRGKSLTVPFVFDGKGLTMGTVIRGEFCVITDVGEEILPYEARVCKSLFDTELGEVKNLFHFTNLARTDWEKAKELFYMPEFCRILENGGQAYFNAYETLRDATKDGDKCDFALDAFLVLINKKQPVTFEIEEKQMSFSGDRLPEEIELHMIRHSWGYDRIHLACNSGLVTMSQTTFEVQDFVDGVSPLVLQLKHDQLKGRNTTIRIENADTQEVLFELQVTKELSTDPDKKQMKLVDDYMMRLYLNYRTGIRPAKEVIRDAKKILSKLQNSDELLVSFYQAHVKLLTGKNNEAHWILKHAKRAMEGKDIPLPMYAYFLYLMAVSDADGHSGEVLDKYARNYPDEFGFFWGKLHKDKMDVVNAGAVYRKCREFFEAGNNSAILYLEAALVLLKEPLVFETIGDFEVHLLHFMNHYALVSDKVMHRFYESKLSLKNYQPLLMQFMDEYPCSDPVKEAKIRSQIYMKNASGAPNSEKADWYRIAIEGDCRITGIYEAYIRALDFAKDEMLPPQVIAYLSYETALDDKHLAYVYTLILQQYHNLRKDYLDKMKAFTIRQLKQGHIDRHLAYLYTHFLTAKDLTEELAARLQELAFANDLYVSNDQYRSVYIGQSGIKDIKKVAIKNNHAIVSLYTSDTYFVFEDKNGWLFVPQSNQIHVEQLMEYDMVEKLIGNYKKRTVADQIYLLDKREIPTYETALDFYERYPDIVWMLSQGYLGTYRKRQVMSDLLHAFVKWGLYDEIEIFLKDTQIDDFHPDERGFYISQLYSAKLDEKAYETARESGFEIVADNVMAGICRNLLCADYTPIQETVRLVYYVFKLGKYTPDMLEYLVEHFYGGTKQMLQIFEASIEMDVYAIRLAERIMWQCMQTGGDIKLIQPIFEYYFKNNGKEEVIEAYLMMQAEEYLLHGTEFAIDQLDKMMREGISFDRTSQLAWLKYYSDHISELSEAQIELAKGYLKDSLNEEIYLELFGKYVAILPELRVYQQKSYAEFWGEPGLDFYLHYEVGGENLCEKMREVYPGIYQCSFMLFWGDELAYAISMENDLAEDAVGTTIKVGVLQRMDYDGKNGQGKFGMINEIAMARNLKDHKSVDVLVKEYARKSYMTSRMLSVK